MSRPTNRPRTDVQQALIDLRLALGFTQEKMAREIGVTLSSLARWETSSAPGFESLSRLASYAAARGYAVLSDRFLAEGTARLRKHFQTSNQPTAQVA